MKKQQIVEMPQLTNTFHAFHLNMVSNLSQGVITHTDNCFIDNNAYAIIIRWEKATSLSRPGWKKIQIVYNLDFL
jgi:hypothetical protein